MINDLRRGDVIYAWAKDKIDYGVIGGHRPYIIVSNDSYNKYSSSVNCVPLTSVKVGKSKEKSPSHLFLGIEQGLHRESCVLCEQICTVSKVNISSKIARLSRATMSVISDKIYYQLALNIE